MFNLKTVGGRLDLSIRHPKNLNINGNTAKTVNGPADCPVGLLCREEPQVPTDGGSFDRF
jgi:hypothetical protein